MRRISREIRNSILSLLDSGLSSREIEARLGVGHTTVNKVRAESRPYMQRRRGGRPARLTAADKRWLVRQLDSGKVDNAVQARQQLRDITNKEASCSTTRRAYKEAELKPRLTKMKPQLLPRHLRQRRAFGKKYKNWTTKEWRHVIFSDETMFKFVGSGGRHVRWRRDGRALTEHDVQSTAKVRGGSLMMWACITAQGVGYACRINDNLNTKIYTSILGGELLQTLAYYGLEKDEIIFQHDNDPKHTSSLATQWLKDNKVEVLEWPSKSPDLNPIENLWAYLKRKLADCKPAPTTIDSLWERVQDEWEKIPEQMCSNLIESMPSRIAAMLKAKGRHIKY
jgi:transposase